MKASLVLNPSHGIKKIEEKPRCVHNVNAKNIYYKNMTRTKQDHDKYTNPKLMLNILQAMWDSTSIYIHWTPNKKNFSKNFDPTCGPCSPMCTHV